MVTARTMLLVSVDLYCTQEGKGLPLIVHHGGPGLDQTVIAPHLSPLASTCSSSVMTTGAADVPPPPGGRTRIRSIGSSAI